MSTSPDRPHVDRHQGARLQDVRLQDVRLQDEARRHLWMHFTRLGSFEDGELPVFVRGSGARLTDSTGRSFLDGLSSLFVVQAGHGRAELAEAGRRQAQELAYYPIWSAAHPSAVELATRLAALAPGDLNRVFFTTGGSEAVESAWKLARAYFKAIGQPARTKVIARDQAYHGTTMGALAITGLQALRTPFEPLVPGVVHVTNTNRFRSAFGPDVTVDDERFAAACAGAIEDAILAEGPDTVAAVFLEPLQNTGGCFVPPPGYFTLVRDICDRHGVLLVSDEVICGFGRLGTWFGAERYGYQPDMVTFAKGVTSGYAPLAGVLCRDFLAAPFLEGDASFAHGITFGGHPVSCAVALANIDVLQDEGIIEHVATTGPALGARLQGLRDLPIVGDVRGDGFFWAVELVKDPDDPSVRFTPEERTTLVRGYVAPRLFAEGLVCRADDRVDPVVQLAPVLVCGDSELDEIEATLRAVLTEAGTTLSRS
ncbi:MAG TPA: aspartate aminotransferase family protein [Acidimicrobiales bacterium]|nr:aspartate aminotransferase family protein [Acidimicrobiales bacterium]